MQQRHGKSDLYTLKLVACFNLLLAPLVTCTTAFVCSPAPGNAGFSHTADS